MFPALGLPVKLPPEVKHADRVMLSTEQRQLMDNRDKWQWTQGFEPLDIRLQCLSPNMARMAFMQRAWDLGFDIELGFKN